MHCALRDAGTQGLVSRRTQKLRALMPWIQKKNLKGAQAAY